MGTEINPYRPGTGTSHSMHSRHGHAGNGHGLSRKRLENGKACVRSVGRKPNVDRLRGDADSR